MTDAPLPAVSDARATTRLRIVEATLRCVERWGIAKTTIEDVATAADLSRATVYRAFPGGRDEVITETVRHEVERFVARIEAAIVDDRSIAAKLEHALMVGHQAIDEHHLLQQMLSTERETILAELNEVGPSMREILAAGFAEALRAEPLRAGVDPVVAAEYLSRMYVSYLGSQGRIDLADRSAVERLVRTKFLAGVLEADPAG